MAARTEYQTSVVKNIVVVLTAKLSIHVFSHHVLFKHLTFLPKPVSIILVPL